MSENQETNTSEAQNETSISQSMPVATLPSDNGANVQQNGLNATSQPRNLQDLLGLSTSLQTEESSSPAQMDPVSAQFLREALANLSVDSVEQLKKKLDIIRELTNESHAKPQKFIPYEEAFEEILDLVECIDHATAFYQIGGLEVVTKLLHHSDNLVQAKAANIIASCCLNNLYCQLPSITKPVFATLIDIAENQTNLNNKYQAIAAISAICRGNQQGIDAFRKFNGLVFLSKFMSKSLEITNEKLVIKTCYLICALTDTDYTIKDDLVELGIVERLISLVRITSDPSVEHYIRTMASVTFEHSPSMRQCLHKKYMFYSCLTHIVAKSKEDEAYQDICGLAGALRFNIRKEARKIVEEGCTDVQIYDLTMCDN